MEKYFCIIKIEWAPLALNYEFGDRNDVVGWWEVVIEST